MNPIPDARRGDVWLVDLDLAERLRPCLLLTDYPADDELAVVTVLPYTTTVRGNRWEFAIPKSFLKDGVFHLQQIQSIAVSRLERRLGELTKFEWKIVETMLVDRFGLRA